MYLKVTESVILLFFCQTKCRACLPASFYSDSFIPNKDYAVVFLVSFSRYLPSRRAVCVAKLWYSWFLCAIGRSKDERCLGTAVVMLFLNRQWWSHFILQNVLFHYGNLLIMVSLFSFFFFFFSQIVKNKSNNQRHYNLLCSIRYLQRKRIRIRKALLPSTILHIQGICCGDVGACIK